ncbi:PAS domain S-box protein [Scytonema sp. UIC 10036]|uniref:adenylate/guanylate cyclase domain-containing protein n=1 Tax=Scytonema sp. UIC 10036 TaxID=2304196 RepID=UPI0012DAB16E|nr:adenylate/guanylate cyclase domain-containing protein [Scytonema sp. UIC 10036]MUG92990.1 PAS domain S-box protein [Scytonema sp. UIC 10036]
MKYQAPNQSLKKYKTIQRKFERLDLDTQFLILYASKQVQRFAANPKEIVLGKDVRLGFPEFIGLEDILIPILKGEQELFELKSLMRTSGRESHLYFDIYILRNGCESYHENRLTILFEDTTETTIAKQQQKNIKILYDIIFTYKSYIEKALAAMAEALLVTTKSGKIKKVNRAALELFGYQEEELINQPISLLFDDNTLLQKAIQQRYLFKKYFQNIEIICRTKEKEKLLIGFSCSVIPSKTDGCTDIIYIGRDITAQKSRQQGISTQYTITRILLESKSIKQAIPKILQAICECLGWDLGELWTANEYITLSSQQDCAHSVLRCVEIWSSRTVAIREFKAVTWQTTYTPSTGFPGRIWSNQSPLWIENFSQPENFDRECDRNASLREIPQSGDVRSQAAVESELRSAFGFPILDNGEMLGVMTFFSQNIQSQNAELLQMMVSVGHQISQFIKSKLSEEVLVEREERYRDLLENADELIQCVTPYGQFEYVNRAWLKTLGYLEMEVNQLYLFDIIHPDFREQYRHILYQVMSGIKLNQVTIAFVSKHGQKIFVEGNINCKFVKGKPVLTRGIFRNVTQRVAVEEAQRHEQEQTERLLLNILPEAIFTRLKEEPGTIAEHFTDVSVLFADIVGFTEIASQISAIQLVKILNQIFSMFDRLTEQYSLEKIKTIGDAYMVVGGLPVRHPNHAQAIACMALDMQTAINEFNSENKQNFSIRVGIHSGPVVAGVIGIKKVSYDLWGDTVNIAHRMESQGLAGKIQVTEAMYQKLLHEFVFQKRGEIEIKGKGKMTTYLMIGRK